MKLILVSVAACLLMAPRAGGQLTGARTQVPAQGGGATAQSQSQTLALEEAERINRRFVELYKQGKYDEALPLARQVLKLREQSLPAADPLLIPALNNLAFALIAKEKYGDAIPHLERSLGLVEKRVGRDSPQLVGVIGQLALALFRHGEKSRAGEFLIRSVEIREKAYGVGHASTAEAVYLLADFYQGRRKYEEAEKLLLRVIGANEGAAQEGRAELAKARGRYLALLMLMGREPDAEALLAKMKEAGYASSPKEVEGGVLNGHAMSKTAPSYPAEARSAGIQGTVAIQVVVDELGRVTKADAISGPRELRLAAVRAVRQWRFSPTLLSNVPISVTGVVTVNFRLN